MKTTTLVKLGLLSVIAVALAGCGGGHGSVTTPAPVTTLKLEDTFGTQFGADYRASPNTEPVKPASGDIVALSLTTEPKALR